MMIILFFVLNFNFDALRAFTGIHGNAGVVGEVIF